MHQLLTIAGQMFQTVFSSPANTRLVYALCIGTRRYYESLSPEKKEQVDRIIRRGAEALLRNALPAVLGDVGRQAFAACGNEQAAEFAKAVVSRAAKVGVERALAEAKQK